MGLKVVTFNLRCQYDRVDGVNSFIHRAGMILDKIEDEKPDVICFQEVVDGMRQFFKLHLNDYTVIGHGRNADFAGEGVSIAFRNDTMELFEAQQFWLSPTPYVPASRFENCQSECPRTCVAVTLKYAHEDIPIRFYAVHLDYIGEKVRALGIRQILDKAAELEKLSKCHNVILGDFNAEPGEEAIRLCDEFADYPIADVTKDTGITFHNFGRGTDDGRDGTKIDYIYIGKELSDSVSDVCLWKDKNNGIYLSDHYPVCCTINFLKKNEKI